MINNLYSDRNKPKNVDEVIIFDELPRKLRVQFKFIMDDLLKNILFSYNDIHKMLCEKYGELSLSSKHRLGVKDNETLTEVLIREEYDIELIFDLMELIIRYKINDFLGAKTIYTSSRGYPDIFACYSNTTSVPSIGFTAFLI